MLSLACHPLLNHSLPHYESQSEVSAKFELTAQFDTPVMCFTSLVPSVCTKSRHLVFGVTLIYLNAITDVEAVKLYLENNHKR